MNVNNKKSFFFNKLFNGTIIPFINLLFLLSLCSLQEKAPRKKFRELSLKPVFSHLQGWYNPCSSLRKRFSIALSLVCSPSSHQL